MHFDRMFQILSLLSILVGFSLVVWELKQNRDITMALLASDGAIGRSERLLQAIEHADVLARACTEHEKLTLKDKLILQAIYDSQYDMLVNRLMNYERSMQSGINWRAGAEGYFRWRFETRFGREYWAEVKMSYPKEVRAIADELLGTIGPVQCSVVGMAS